MTYTVRLASHAQRDLARLPDFLVPQSRRAAARARQAILEAIRSLDEFPDRGRRDEEGILREILAPFGRDAYIIIYRVDADVVVVARIFHSREQRR